MTSERQPNIQPGTMRDKAATAVPIPATGQRIYFWQEDLGGFVMYDFIPLI